MLETVTRSVERNLEHFGFFVMHLKRGLTILVSFFMTHLVHLGNLELSLSLTSLNLLVGCPMGMDFQAYRLNIVPFHGELCVLRRGCLFYALLEFVFLD